MRLRNVKYKIFIILLFTQLSHMGNAPISGVDFEKVHPKFRALMTENNSLDVFKNGNAISAGSYVDGSGNVRYGVIIKAEDVSELRSAGIGINSSYPGFVTAKLTLEQIARISRLNSIRYIDAPSITYPKMNVSTPATGASLLHNGFYNNTVYAGEGAIVVIFDTGIDYNHIDFKNPEDTTKSRILFIWDQVPESGEKNPPAGFDYGFEYTQANINDEIDGSPAGFIRQKDTNGHGTHVAGTAVGSGVKFPGIAPKADIIVVKGGNGSFAEDHIIDGINYADSIAVVLGKPVVVNLSLGGHTGPHDGTRAYEQVIDAFNSKPGQAVVVAAGNEGNTKIHIGGSVASAGNTSFQIDVPASYTPNDGPNNDEFIFDLWYDENVSVTAKVRTPTGNSYSMGYNTYGTFYDTDGTIYIENRRVDDSKQVIHLHVYDSDATKTPAFGTWKLELENASGDLIYDGWLARSDLGGEEASLENGDVDKTVAMPGTATEAITVGAYVTRMNWPAIDGNTYGYNTDIDFDYVGGIANFSSHGPTRDGRMKPEITAPGKATVSTYSSDSDAIEQIINPDGKHVRFQGTSMATPHVAGAAAVLLAIDPSMTAGQLKTFMANTAVKDSDTGGSANNTWGDGKLDLLKAVVSKASGDMSITRTLQEYFIDESGPYITFFTGTVKLAVRYTAPHNGRLSGAYLTTVISVKDVDPPNEPTYPVIEGDGTLNIAVFSDNNGIPDTQIGSTVMHSLTLLDAGTKNYINLLPAGVSVNKDEIIHLVLALANPSDKVKVLFDGGSTEQIENPSFINTVGNWQTAKERWGTPYNLRLSAEIVDMGPAASISETEETIARTFELEQNYPNPFNPATKIRFSLSQSGQVDLTVFDILGRKVVTIVDEVAFAGVHEVEWNSRNSAGLRVPSGVYFYRLRSQEGILTKKMLLVK